LRLLERVAARFALSARAYHRLLKVARTIADLQAADLITPEHIGEAASLRLAAAMDFSPGGSLSLAAPGSAGLAYWPLDTR